MSAFGRRTTLQKQVAVVHFMEYGQCMAFTRRTLGYPSREALTDWINELHPELRLQSPLY
jgi:putative transposase